MVIGQTFARASREQSESNAAHQRKDLSVSVKMLIKQMLLRQKPISSVAARARGLPLGLLKGSFIAATPLLLLQLK